MAEKENEAGHSVMETGALGTIKWKRNMKRCLQAFFFILALFVIVAGALWLSNARRAELAEKKQPEPPAYAVFIDTAEQGAIALIRSFPGTVEPVEHVVVSFRMTGHVKSAGKEAGDRVAEGEIVAEIDERPLQRQKQAVKAELAGAESDQVQAEKQLARRRMLLDKGHIDPEALDAAESAYQTARSKTDSLRARLASARIDLAYTKARSPFDGVITARHKQEGDLAMPGEPVYSIENPAAGYRVVVRIPGKAAFSAGPGDKAAVRFHSRRMETTLHRIYPSTREGRLALAEFRLEQRPFDLPSGSLVGVDLVLREASGMLVSARTLLEKESGTKVFRLNDQNRIEMIKVTVVGRKGSEAIVAGPVSPGDRLVAAEESMLLRLTEGTPVSPLQQQAKTRKSGGAYQ